MFTQKNKLGAATVTSFALGMVAFSVMWEKPAYAACYEIYVLFKGWTRVCPPILDQPPPRPNIPPKTEPAIPSSSSEPTCTPTYIPPTIYKIRNLADKTIAFSIANEKGEKIYYTLSPYQSMEYSIDNNNKDKCDKVKHYQDRFIYYFNGKRNTLDVLTNKGSTYKLMDFEWKNDQWFSWDRERLRELGLE